MPEKKRSSSLERRVQGYPPHQIHHLLQQYVIAHGCTESEVVTEALRAFLVKTKIISKLNPA